MICEVHVVKFMQYTKDLGVIRCIVLNTCDDDDEIVFQRRWLRQILVPSAER